MQPLFEYEARNGCRSCTDWRCACDCHDDQYLDPMFRWVDNGTGDAWTDEDSPGQVAS